MRPPQRLMRLFGELRKEGESLSNPLPSHPLESFSYGQSAIKLDRDKPISEGRLERRVVEVLIFANLGHKGVAFWDSWKHLASLLAPLGKVID
jgi:hypothetical protein